MLFSQNKNHQFITLEQFGVAAKGKDETTAILKAFQYAKMNKKAIHLLNEKIYIFSPDYTVDITGIPAILGKGTFDVSKTGKNAGNPSMTAIFQVTGSKKLLQRSVTGIRQNESKLKLSAGLKLVKGDILFFSSTEKLANTKRAYYAKGQRAVVKSYDAATGMLMIEDIFFYNIQQAFVWLNNEMPKIQVGTGVGFITSPMNFMTCFKLQYAEGNISGYYRNFALSAIMFSSSQGVVNNMEADLPVTDNNGYSYCIVTNDMSDITIKNCSLTGGRHVISGGGGGLWRLSESNGSGGNVAYPSIISIDGGLYKGSKNVLNINADNATIDSHGVIEKMVIKNCTIYGGVNLGANFVEVENVTVYADSKRAFNVGSDVLPGSDWGIYKISNVKIIWDKANKNSMFLSKADVIEIALDNVVISNISIETLLMDFALEAPKKIFINRLCTGLVAPLKAMRINKKSHLVISNSKISKESIQRTGQ